MANLQILAEREITQNSGKNEEKATTNKNDLILQKKDMAHWSHGPNTRLILAD